MTTESSKHRMEELADAHAFSGKFSNNNNEAGNALASFQEGYQAGMQDPDAGKLSIDDYLGLYERIGKALKDTGVPLTTHEMAEIRNVIRSHAKANDENKKLREAMQFAIDHLSSMDDYSIVNGAIHSLKEALSSGGE